MKLIFKTSFKHVFLFLILSSLLSCNKKDSIKTIHANTDWKFKRLEETTVTDESFNKITFDATGWETVSLPHTANIEPLVVNNQWQGVCWYRKKFDVPVNVSEGKVFLELEAAMNYSKIWVNGMLVSEHYGGYLPIVVDISSYVNKGKNNVLAIRLDNTDNKITGPKPLKRLDFNMYGGLYRNAWLSF